MSLECLTQIHVPSFHSGTAALWFHHVETQQYELKNCFTHQTSCWGLGNIISRLPCMHHLCCTTQKLFLTGQTFCFCTNVGPILIGRNCNHWKTGIQFSLFPPLTVCVTSFRAESAADSLPNGEMMTLKTSTHQTCFFVYSALQTTRII